MNEQLRPFIIDFLQQPDVTATSPDVAAKKLTDRISAHFQGETIDKKEVTAILRGIAESVAGGKKRKRLFVRAFNGE